MKFFEGAAFPVPFLIVVVIFSLKILNCESFWIGRDDLRHCRLPRHVLGRSSLSSLSAATAPSSYFYGVVSEDGSVPLNSTTSSNLSSPRHWLEQNENGVYTVMRLDFNVTEDTDGTLVKNWVLWGKEFHLARLRESYQIWCNASSTSNMLVPDSVVHKATICTENVIGTLLEKAKESQKTIATACTKSSIYTYMVTILWHPKTDPFDIAVKGHIFSSLQPMIATEQNQVDPVTVVLANDTSGSLPSRRKLPYAKLSEWCTTRRPLEEIFLKNASEVVMLDQDNAGVCTILEGLTSNLVFVYPNGELRSTRHGVLNGYARELVFEAARQLGYRTSLTSVSLAESHLWQEVFLTSSVRLIVPIQRMFIGSHHVDDGTVESSIVWETTTTADASIFKALYRELITSMHSIQRAT